MFGIYSNKLQKERRKREIEPVIDFLESLKNIDDQSDNAKEFAKLLQDLSSVSTKINNIMDLAIKSDEHWLVGKLRIDEIINSYFFESQVSKIIEDSRCIILFRISFISLLLSTSPFLFVGKCIKLVLCT